MATATTTLEHLGIWANHEALHDLVAILPSLLGPHASASHSGKFYQRIHPSLQNPKPRHLDPHSFWTFLGRS
eukprot:4601502-Pyramimonas_sp.AAC.1